ncbi:MAG: hypothetical protein MJA83_00090 [Gammaproteobacteria bacterium]|nr:hypothetical protein [Gammaproteobacteria bacterium]
MAYKLSVILACKPMEFASVLQAYLERDTRPIFEEDMSEEDRGLFEIIEKIEYPASADALNERLYLQWFEEDDLEFKDLKSLLDTPKIQLLAAHEIPDDPLSYDEDCEDGWYWVSVDKHYKQVWPKDAINILPREIMEKL